MSSLDDLLNEIDEFEGSPFPEAVEDPQSSETLDMEATVSEPTCDLLASVVKDLHR